MVRLLALVACGTRTVIDATFGSTALGETTYACQLLRALHPGMIVLADRGFDGQPLVTAIAATGADLLVRVKNGRRLPVCSRLADGSWLSRMGPVEVRVIRCEITISTSAGRRTGIYQLVTTVCDPVCPARDLIRLYHDRWEVETAYLEIKSTILGGRVLRAKTPAGLDQEIYALLVTYQALRIAIADATLARPDIDPDRGSFTVALHAARDRLAQAADLWIEGGWIFAQPTGQPIDPRADYEEWRVLLTEAGVRPARLHDARHTAATMLLVLKVPTRAVMDVMGWSQASMATRYQHVPTEVLTGIADLVGGLLWQTPNPDDEGDDGASGALAPTA
nr:transposase [Frankia sp. Cppng1_Ct_nod]